MGRPKLRNLPDLSDLARAGAQITVRVTPRVAQTRLSRNGENIQIAVPEPPEDGKANAAVRIILAKSMHIAPTGLTLIRGQTARTKVFSVDETGN